MDDYKYLALTQSERKGMLDETLLAQERDYYMHNLNAERYELILADTSLDHESEFAHRIHALLTETLLRKQEVKLILNAVIVQMKDI